MSNKKKKTLEKALEEVDEIIERQTLNIKLKKLDDRAVIPTYAHNGDVGMDLTAIDVEYDEKKDLYIYHTGLAFESDFNVGQFLFPRSSNCKTDCYLTNSVGIADSAIYRGEIQFRFKNRDSLNMYKELKGQEAYNNALFKGLAKYSYTLKPFQQVLFSAMDEAAKQRQMVVNEIENNARELKYAPYNVGDKIGQMVFMHHPTVNIDVVEELSETERGDGGFGSTGK